MFTLFLLVLSSLQAAERVAPGDWVELLDSTRKTFADAAEECTKLERSQAAFRDRRRKEALKEHGELYAALDADQRSLVDTATKDNHLVVLLKHESHGLRELAALTLETKPSSLEELKKVLTSGVLDFELESRLKFLVRRLTPSAELVRCLNTAADAYYRKIFERLYPEEVAAGCTPLSGKDAELPPRSPASLPSSPERALEALTQRSRECVGVDEERYSKVPYATVSREPQSREILSANVLAAETCLRSAAADFAENIAASVFPSERPPVCRIP